MATTYYQSADSSDLTGGSLWSNLIEGSGQASAGNVFLTGSSGTQGTGSFFTGPAVPGAFGSTGSYTVTVNSTSSASNRTLAVQLHRVNSAGTIQASSAASATQSLTTTGVKSFSFASANLGSWTAGDRLRVDFILASSGGGNATVNFSVGETVNSRVDTPFTFSTAYALAAAAGSFGVIGVASILRSARKTAAAAGSFAVTRIVAGLKRGYALPVTKAAMNVGGVAAALRKAVRFSASARPFAVTGVAANVSRGARIALGAGAIALTLLDAALTAVQRVFSTVPAPGERTAILRGAGPRIIVLEPERPRSVAADARTIVLPATASRLIIA